MFEFLRDSYTAATSLTITGKGSFRDICGPLFYLLSIAYKFFKRAKGKIKLKEKTSLVISC